MDGSNDYQENVLKRKDNLNGSITVNTTSWRRYSSILKMGENERRFDDDDMTKSRKSKRVSFSSRVQIQTFDGSALEQVNAEKKQQLPAVLADKIQHNINDSVIPFYMISSPMERRLDVSQMMDFGNNTTYTDSDGPTMMSNLTMELFDDTINMVPPSSIATNMLNYLNEDVSNSLNNEDRDSPKIFIVNNKNNFDYDINMAAQDENLCRPDNNKKVDIDKTNSIPVQTLLPQKASQLSSVENVLSSVILNKNVDTKSLENGLQSEYFMLKKKKDELSIINEKINKTIEQKKSNINKILKDNLNVKAKIQAYKKKSIERLAIINKKPVNNDKLRQKQTDLDTLKKQNEQLKKKLIEANENIMIIERNLASNLSKMSINRENYTAVELYNQFFTKLLNENNFSFKLVDFNDNFFTISLYFDYLNVQIYMSNMSSLKLDNNDDHDKIEIKQISFQNKMPSDAPINYQFCYSLIVNDRNLKVFNKHYKTVDDLPKLLSHLQLICGFAETLTKDLVYCLNKYENFNIDFDDFSISVILPSLSKSRFYKLRVELKPGYYYCEPVKFEISPIDEDGYDDPINFDEISKHLVGRFLDEGSLKQYLNCIENL